MNKTILKQIILLLIVFSCVIFALYIYYSASINGKEGLFKGTGAYVEAIMDTEMENDNDIECTEDTEEENDVPLLNYMYGTQTVGTSVKFKSLFTVTTKNGEKPGDVEDDFTLYLSDITDVSDNSVVEVLSTEMIENLEEIPAAFIYDKEQDILYFHKSGAFKVYVNVYNEKGYKTAYEFMIPVEVGGLSL